MKDMYRVRITEGLKKKYERTTAKINMAGDTMDGKELKKGGSQSWEVIDHFSEKLHSDLMGAGYEGEELKEVFAKEKASFVSAVNQFKEEARKRNANR